MSYWWPWSKYQPMSSMISMTFIHPTISAIPHLELVIPSNNFHTKYTNPFCDGYQRKIQGSLCELKYDLLRLIFLNFLCKFSRLEWFFKLSTLEENSLHFCFIGKCVILFQMFRLHWNRIDFPNYISQYFVEFNVLVCFCWLVFFVIVWFVYFNKSREKIVRKRNSVIWPIQCFSYVWTNDFT